MTPDGFGEFIWNVMDVIKTHKDVRNEPNFALETTKNLKMISLQEDIRIIYDMGLVMFLCAFVRGQKSFSAQKL